MQISSIRPVQPPSTIERHADPVQARLQTQVAPGQRNTAAPAVPKAFTPAPPLRPNVQDYVDIDRTLIELRRL